MQPIQKGDFGLIRIGFSPILVVLSCIPIDDYENKLLTVDKVCELIVDGR